MSGFRVAVVDNHDSFVHTLVDYVRELGAVVTVVESDEVSGIADLPPHDAVLVSPGPGDPIEAGASVQIVRDAARRRTPLLGVCLGHQAIGVAFGGRVVHAPELMHGMTSVVHHDGDELFEGLADGFSATRYHSLTVDPRGLPAELRVTASTPSGVVMGLAHRELPIRGVQFHPESILTEGGYRLLGNWLESAGLAGAAARGEALAPRGGAVMRPSTS